MPSTPPKTPLLLLPGLLLDGALWAHQAAHLAEICDIHIGDISRGDSLTGIARGVLADAPPHFALAGLSMGGYVAQEIMRLAPGRVTRLALLNTSARADTTTQARRRRGLLALAERGRFKGVTPRLLRLYLHPDRLDDAAVTQPIMAAAQALGRDVFIRQTRAVMARPDGRNDLAKIACPTLVVCGRQDQTAPLALSEEIAGLVPGADLVVLGRCGHLPPLERPAETTAHLRIWLQR